MQRIIIKEMLGGELGDSAWIHDLRQERMAILLSFPDTRKEQCSMAADNLIHRLNALFNDHPDFPIIFGIGTLCNRLLDVYRSHKEAVKALEMLDFSRGQSSLRYDRMSNDDRGYYYPLEIEQRMMNLVKSGNAQEVGKLLDTIRGEMTTGQVSADALQLLIFDLTATVYKLMQDMVQTADRDAKQKHTSFIETVSSFSAFHEAYEYISASLIQLSESVSSQKKSHNIDLKNNIVGYIDNNYRNGNLSLAHVADHFNISEVYLSQFFKEQTGENFSIYMENKRMRHARELLMQPQITIEEIARQVGYVNTNTFYKAFKRLEGISPGAYRSKQDL